MALPGGPEEGRLGATAGRVCSEDTGPEQASGAPGQQPQQGPETVRDFLQSPQCQWGVKIGPRAQTEGHNQEPKYACSFPLRNEV